MSAPYDAPDDGDNRQPDEGCQFCSVLDDEMSDACEGCRHNPEYKAKLRKAAEYVEDGGVF